MSAEESALLVEVPEVEPAVGHLRRLHDPVATRGVPAHVTILYPFAHPDAVAGEIDAIAETVAHTAAFTCTFASIEEFPNAIWLQPDPAAPFDLLTRALWARFPQFPPYGGSIPDPVPHLSIAQGSVPPPGLRSIVEGTVGPLLPISARVALVSLFVCDRQGAWSRAERFALGPPAEADPPTP